MKHRAFQKFIMLLLLISAVFFTGMVRAQEKHLIYVAGNPDFYPLEYYDGKSEQYRGVLPDLLRDFSEQSEYEIVYLRPGEKDRRHAILQNLQAELISGCRPEDGFTEAIWQDGTQVFTAERDGTVSECRILFTEVADETLRKALTAYCAQLSAATVNGLLLENTAEPRGGIPLLAVLILSGVILALAGTLTVVLLKSRKRINAMKANRYKDPVTGLGNAGYLARYYRQFVNDQNRALYQMIYFKTDTQELRRLAGTAETEDFLKHTAILLQEYTADTDILARVSEDGFVIVKLTPNDAETETWLKIILERVRQYPEEFNRSFRIDFHAGIYRIQQSDRDLPEILFNAEQSCHYACTNELDYVFCSNAVLAAYREQIALQQHMETAFRNEEFVLYLHFFIDSKSSRINGAEALCHWLHPEKGDLPPARFISLMEREALIIQLDFYILEKVCRLLEELDRKGVQSFFISCNFSRKTFALPDFAERASAIIEKYTFVRGLLILELTENNMMKNNELTHRNILRMKEFGVSMALDDFGAGFSSFYDLMRYPTDILKLDKIFMQSLHTEEGRMIVKGIIDLGHALGMLVLCEGVEQEEQIACLRSLACDVIQGFYYYRPMPAEEACKLYLKQAKTE